MDIEDLKLLRLLLSGKKIIEISEQINLTQPAVTARIKKLRHIFQDEIIVRKGKQVSLTTKAISMTNTILRLCENIEDLIPSHQFDPYKNASTIYLHMSETMFYLCSDAIIEKIYGYNVDHHVNIEVFPTELGIEKKYDFNSAELVLGGAQSIEGFNQEVLGWDHFALGYQDFKIKQKEPGKLTMKEYLKLPHIAFSKAEDNNLLLANLSHPDPRNVVVRTNSLSILCQTLKDKYVCTIPSCFAYKYNLRTLPLPFENMPIPIMLSYPPYLQMDTKNKWLRKICSDVINTYININSDKIKSAGD